VLEDPELANLEYVDALLSLCYVEGARLQGAKLGQIRGLRQTPKNQGLSLQS
jgi:hypothetical protein